MICSTSTSLLCSINDDSTSYAEDSLWSGPDQYDWPIYSMKAATEVHKDVQPRADGLPDTVLGADDKYWTATPIWGSAPLPWVALFADI